MRRFALTWETTLQTLQPIVKKVRQRKTCSSPGSGDPSTYRCTRYMHHVGKETTDNVLHNELKCKFVNTSRKMIFNSWCELRASEQKPSARVRATTAGIAQMSTVSRCTAPSIAAIASILERRDSRRFLASRRFLRKSNRMSAVLLQILLFNCRVAWFCARKNRYGRRIKIRSSCEATSAACIIR